MWENYKCPFEDIVDVLKTLKIHEERKKRKEERNKERKLVFSNKTLSIITKLDTPFKSHSRQTDFGRAHHELFWDRDSYRVLECLHPQSPSFLRFTDSDRTDTWLWSLHM